MDREPRLSVSPDSNERISLADTRGMAQWATKLGISAEHLRELVARVGPRVRDLLAELTRPESLD
jgi:DNA-binding phage protein